VTAQRRTITVDEDVHRAVQLVRATLLRSDIDLDYTSAINFLAELGYGRLTRVGWKKAITRTLAKFAGNANLQTAGLEDAFLELQKKGPQIFQDEEDSK
jgi:hypothetical protein